MLEFFQHFATQLKILNGIQRLIFNQNTFCSHASFYKLIFELRCFRIWKPF